MSVRSQLARRTPPVVQPPNNSWRFRLARWLLRSTGYGVYRTDSLKQVHNITLALQQFASESGHLARAYNAGFRVSSFARNLLYFLERV